MNENNLIPYKAKDGKAGDAHVQGRVSPEIKKWLQTLPEGESYHIRQALKEYYAKKQNDSASRNDGGTSI